MKRCYLILGTLLAFSTLQAQYVDFGQQYGADAGDFAVADIDNDGDLDIIFSGRDEIEKGFVMINDGSGNFTEQTGERLFKIGRGGNIQFGDVDGDGDIDVIFTGWGTNTSSRGIALNDGHGVFTLADKAKYPVSEAAKLTSCGFADFNLDGLLDYYFIGNYTPKSEPHQSNITLYFQQTDGSFVAQNSSFQDLKLNEPEVTITDFDNDGCPDIFITAGNESAADNENKRFSYLYKNDGFGDFIKFEGAAIFRMKSNGTSSWSDFNGDGYMDLLLNGDGFLNSGEDSDFMARIYKNMSGASVSVAMELSYGRQGSMGNGSAIVDWDGDGKLDYFLAGWIGNKQSLDLFLGDNPADFSFIKSPLGNTDFPGISEQAIRIADLNADNKPDILVCGYSGGTLDFKRRIAGYIKNQSTKASVPPAAPTNLTAVVDDSDGLMVTFSWEAPASENGKYGTTYNFALKNTTTGKWFYNPMSVMGGTKDGWRKVAGRQGNVFLNKEFFLYDLPDGSYEWTVQAINGAYIGGKFAETKTFTIGSASIDKVNKNNCKVIFNDNTLAITSNATDEQTLNLYNIGGSLVRSISFIGNATMKMDQAGVYIVEVLEQDGSVYRTKAVVK